MAITLRSNVNRPLTFAEVDANFNEIDTTTVKNTGYTSTAPNHAHTVGGTTQYVGSDGTNKNLPPYYALAYIMKV